MAATRRKMTRSEAGRLGAEARWGKSSSRRRSSAKTSGRSTSSRTTSLSRTSRASRSRSAGQRGGKAVLEKYGPEFYSEISRRSRSRQASKGQSKRGGNRAEHQRAGRAGASARWGRGSEEDYSFGRGSHFGRFGSRQEAGYRGDEAVLSKYGPEFYREIGRRGGQARRGSRSF